MNINKIDLIGYIQPKNLKHSLSKSEEMQFKDMSFSRRISLDCQEFSSPKCMSHQNLGWSQWSLDMFYDILRTFWRGTSFCRPDVLRFLQISKEYDLTKDGLGVECRQNMRTFRVLTCECHWYRFFLHRKFENPNHYATTRVTFSRCRGLVMHLCNEEDSKLQEASGWKKSEKIYI